VYRSSQLKNNNITIIEENSECLH